MKLLFKRLIAAFVVLSLTACGPGMPSLVKNDSGGKGTVVGPATSTQLEAKPIPAAQLVQPVSKLDVIIPVFDPGLNDPDKNKKLWPELRRAEANAYSWDFKKALDATGEFGATRVAPDATASGDIYVIGRIDESNGEKLEISIQVIDISGQDMITRTRISGFNAFSSVVGDSLSSKSFSQELDSSFFNDVRNKEKKPYQALFDEMAAYVASIVQEMPETAKKDLKNVSTLRFATSLSNDTFGEHLENKEGLFKVKSLPSDEDATYQKVLALQVRDQLFIDKLQNEYEAFSQKFGPSHRVWQEQVMLEAEARKETKSKGTGEALTGIALIGLAILSANQAIKISAKNKEEEDEEKKRTNSAKSTLATTTAVLAGVVGASRIYDSMHSFEEAEVHNELIDELGDSLDLEVAPQNVAFEESQTKLVGDAAEQFRQWRAFLKKIYELEKTPNIQL